MEDQVVFDSSEMEFLKIYEGFNPAQKKNLLAIIEEALCKQTKEKLMADKTTTADVDQWSKN